MGWLSRRRPAVANPAAGAAAHFEHDVRWGLDVWRGLDVPAPWQQNAVYGARVLTEAASNYPGIQRDNGVGGMYVGWMVPSRSVRPIWQQTQQIALTPGPQRMGSTAPVQMGPIGVRSMQRAVFAAQVDQSGLAAMSWADQLHDWASG